MIFGVIPAFYIILIGLAYVFCNKSTFDFSNVRSNKATYYVGYDKTAMKCGQKETKNALLVLALSKKYMASGTALCNTCIALSTRWGNKVCNATVRVSDQCDGCQDEQIDLADKLMQALSFELTGSKTKLTSVQVWWRFLNEGQKCMESDVSFECFIDNTPQTAGAEFGATPETSDKAKVISTSGPLNVSKMTSAKKPDTQPPPQAAPKQVSGDTKTPPQQQPQPPSQPVAAPAPTQPQIQPQPQVPVKPSDAPAPSPDATKVMTLPQESTMLSPSLTPRTPGNNSNILTDYGATAESFYNSKRNPFEYMADEIYQAYEEAYEEGNYNQDWIQRKINRNMRYPIGRQATFQPYYQLNSFNDPNDFTAIFPVISIDEDYRDFYSSGGNNNDDFDDKIRNNYDEMFSKKKDEKKVNEIDKKLMTTKGQQLKAAVNQKKPLKQAQKPANKKNEKEKEKKNEKKNEKKKEL